VLNFGKQPDASSSGSWLDRLKRGLKKTGSQLTGLFGGTKVDEQLFEDLESALISADAGLDATQTLIERLRARAKTERIETPQALKEALAVGSWRRSSRRSSGRSPSPPTSRS
jgi:fused signal recognition particle receptor